MLQAKSSACAQPGETAWYLREQKACVCTCGSVFPGTCVRCTVGSETGQTDRIAL